MQAPCFRESRPPFGMETTFSQLKRQLGRPDPWLFDPACHSDIGRGRYTNSAGWSPKGRENPHQKMAYSAGQRLVVIKKFD